MLRSHDSLPVTRRLSTCRLSQSKMSSKGSNERLCFLIMLFWLYNVYISCTGYSENSSIFLFQLRETSCRLSQPKLLSKRSDSRLCFLIKFSWLYNVYIKCTGNSVSTAISSPQPQAHLCPDSLEEFIRMADQEHPGEWQILKLFCLLGPGLFDDMTKSQTGIFQLGHKSHTSRGIAKWEMPTKRTHPSLCTVQFFCHCLRSQTLYTRGQLKVFIYPK